MAIVIDTDTHNDIASEITQYKQDLERDTNYKIFIKDFSSDANIESIKDYLKNLYFDENLKIAVFVGEIPTAMYFPGTVSQISIPTDYYYYDIYDKCPYNEQNQAFEARDKFCSPITLPFLITRITSPIKGQEGMQLLKDYFNNNHAFRTGNVEFNQKALVYSPVLNDVSNPEQVLEHMQDNLKSPLKIFQEEELFFAEWEEGSDGTEFLNELSKNYQYVHVEAHGSPTEHQFNINKDSLNDPNAFYAYFTSCNVGKFTEQDYIAGYYLLKGKTMFVTASSDYHYGPVGSINSRKLFLLKQSQPFSKIIESALNPMYVVQHFGDPTLKMPQGEVQKSSTAKMCLKGNQIDFGKIKVCESIIDHKDCEDPSGISKIDFDFSNIGIEDLGFHMQSRPDYSLQTIQNSYPLGDPEPPYRISFYLGEGGSIFDELNTVKPDEAKNVIISLLGLAAGEYTGKILIYNNDPKNPIIEIP